MFISNYNHWTQKNYEYHIDSRHLSTDTFNQNLHNNDQIPQVVDPYVCGYCNTRFSTRNNLFYHLGFMNIDTRDLDGIDTYNSFNHYLKKWTKKRKFKEYNNQKHKKRKIYDVQKAISNFHL
jgi:hypothetical protein